MVKRDKYEHPLFRFAIQTNGVMNYAITLTLFGYISSPVELYILKHNGYFSIILPSHQPNRLPHKFLCKIINKSSIATGSQNAGQHRISVKYVCINLNVHRVSDVRQIEIHTAAPLVPYPSPFKVEIAIARFKSLNCRVVIKFQQNLFMQEVKY
jgi:hypothetical protein